jgi:hypothetical protein
LPGAPSLPRSLRQGWELDGRSRGILRQRPRPSQAKAMLSTFVQSRSPPLFHFDFLDLAVMTLLYIPFRDDIVFLQEHI